MPEKFPFVPFIAGSNGISPIGLAACQIAPLSNRSCGSSGNGRSQQQVGKKGRDKGRWLIGVNRCWLRDSAGRVVGWAWDTMKVHDQDFPPLIERQDGETITLSDLGFRCATDTPKT